jgi:hypothetical protein
MGKETVTFAGRGASRPAAAQGVWLRRQPRCVFFDDMNVPSLISIFLSSIFLSFLRKLANRERRGFA